MSFLIGGLFIMVSIFAFLSVGSLATDEILNARRNRELNAAYESSGKRHASLIHITGVGQGLSYTHDRSSWYTPELRSAAEKAAELEKRGNYGEASAEWQKAANVAMHERTRSQQMTSESPNANERADAFHNTYRELREHADAVKRLASSTPADHSEHYTQAREEARQEDINRRAAEYEAQGLSRSEAKDKAFFDRVRELHGKKKE